MSNSPSFCTFSCLGQNDKKSAGFGTCVVLAWDGMTSGVRLKRRRLSGSNGGNFSWTMSSELMDEKHKYYVKEKLISEGKMEELMIRRGQKTDKMISAKATNHFMHPEGTPSNRTPLR